MECRDMRIIDTHAHYDDKAFDEDRAALLASLPEKGIVCAVNMGASMRGARESIVLAQKWPHVFAACGLHPDDVGELEEAENPADPGANRILEKLRALCRHPKCLAVGEIGLDYHWMVQPKEIQKKWFIRQLKLAKELNLPVNIHSRDAAQDTFDIMKEYHACATPGIIHCYSGSAEMAAEYVRMGYFLGIGGVVTFQNGKTLKKVVEQVPLENLVTETDCPYLAPVPFRGKRNASDYLPYVVEAIAGIKGLEPEETARVLFENARRAYPGLQTVYR